MGAIFLTLLFLLPSFVFIFLSLYENLYLSGEESGISDLSMPLASNHHPNSELNSRELRLRNLHNEEHVGGEQQEDDHIIEISIYSSRSWSSQPYPQKICPTSLLELSAKSCKS